MSNTLPRFGFIGTGIWVRRCRRLLLRLVTWFSSPRFSAATRPPPRRSRQSTASAPRLISTASSPASTLSASPCRPARSRNSPWRRSLPASTCCSKKPVAVEVEAANRIADGLDEKGLKSLVFFTSLINPRNVTWLADVHAVGGWTGGRVDAFSGVLVDPANPLHLDRALALRHRRVVGHRAPCRRHADAGSSAGDRGLCRRPVSATSRPRP